ncbi:hypothetical protein TBK1r_04400 [Stieleria magnilauensis]|uniref:Uncharacterized protein n=1 Tax=Stieleria magnilauensis TaxID=2527963 RepID=A0ABX5XIB0_9BACT|nr:hypothetical protein TBK1r_04400 [Planctomycetes bacterium TBK1r]
MLGCLRTLSRMIGLEPLAAPTPAYIPPLGYNGLRLPARRLFLALLSDRRSFGLVECGLMR